MRLRDKSIGKDYLELKSHIIQRVQQLMPGASTIKAQKVDETITSAAIKIDGVITIGKNHPAILLSLGEQIPKDRSGPEYGFVTSKGRFVSREEAAVIAGVENTIKEGSLYSEDLTAARRGD